MRPKIFACFDGPFPFLADYYRVTAAIKRRDPEGARAAILGHLDSVWRLWHEHLAIERRRAGERSESERLGSWHAPAPDSYPE